MTDPNAPEPTQDTPTLLPVDVPDPEPAHQDVEEWDAERAAAEGVPGEVEEPAHDPAATDPGEGTEAAR